MTYVVLLHIHTRKTPSAAIADSLNFSQMGLFHMPDMVILLDNPQTSRPCTPHSLLATLHNWKTQLLVANVGRVREGLCFILRYE